MQSLRFRATVDSLQSITLRQLLNGEHWAVGHSRF